MIDLAENDEIKIVIVDDHEVVRTGLRKSLSQEERFRILAEADNGQDALDIIRNYRPDVVLLDILMPKLTGIEVAKTLKKEFPNLIIIILTAFNDTTHLEQALAIGADGYLAKDISIKDLTDSIFRVIKGERVFSKSVIQLINDEICIDADSYTIALSNREQQILNYVASGITSDEIARLLEISIRTVQGHRSNIMQKLNIKTASGLVRYAVLNVKSN